MEQLIPLDYTTLRIIWWVLLGFLLAAFAVMDGFDLGVATVLPLVSRTDVERRVVFNVVGPVWEGNQVWLVVGGGVVFAAWPLLYAMAFSGFYLAMMLLLIALILRPICFKYRSKMPDARWRSTWDVLMCLCGLVASLVFGVAVGNVIGGVPFVFEPDTMRPIYQGGFFGLFMPFPVLCGVVSVCMLAMHGSVLLSWKTEGAVAARARACARGFGVLTLALFILAGVWVAHGVEGYSIVGAVQTGLASSPMGKAVAMAPGGWMHNYVRWPAIWIAPAAGVAGALLAAALVGLRSGAPAFLASSASIVGIVWTFGLSLFPFLLPSSVSPNVSLTVWDASSSHMSLWIMLIATGLLLPVVMLYTAWVYRVMRGKVTEKSVEGGHAY
jgi:cytochrome d ubiquinol oxidase subunit II